jgi:putative transcriptional regulator
VTKEGVDWLITRTDALRELVEHVSTDVIGQVDVETAIATTRINAGQLVSLTMGRGSSGRWPATPAARPRSQ